jgi:hypothetical protein
MAKSVSSFRRPYRGRGKPRPCRLRQSARGFRRVPVESLRREAYELIQLSLPLIEQRQENKGTRISEKREDPPPTQSPLPVFQKDYLSSHARDFVALLNLRLHNQCAGNSHGMVEKLYPAYRHTSLARCRIMSCSQVILVAPTYAPT